MNPSTCLAIAGITAALLLVTYLNAPDPRVLADKSRIGGFFRWFSLCTGILGVTSIGSAVWCAMSNTINVFTATHVAFGAGATMVSAGVRVIAVQRGWEAAAHREVIAALDRNSKDLRTETLRLYEGLLALHLTVTDLHASVLRSAAESTDLALSLTDAGTGLRNIEAELLKFRIDFLRATTMRRDGILDEDRAQDD